MEIQMTRIIDDGDTTIGLLQCDDLRMATLEDEARGIKIYGETRIPAWRYEIKLREDSPMANRYRDRFGPDHKGIPWLQDVPNFEWIYFHPGTDDDDTDACILTGEKANFTAMTVEASVRAYRALQRKIQEALEHSRVFVTIRE